MRKINNLIGKTATIIGKRFTGQTVKIVKVMNFGDCTVSLRDGQKIEYNLRNLEIKLN